MSILVNRETRLVVQGITGRFGAYYSRKLLEAGTRVVAGVTPGKGGTRINGLPVYDNLHDALRDHLAEATLLFVPGTGVKGALLEAIDAGMPVVICVVDGVPERDMLIVKRRLRECTSIMIGPNSPGIITPGEFVAGFMPPNAFIPGPVGIISRSGTLTYQTASLLSEIGIGQSTALGIGGDPVVGIGFAEALALFNADPATRLIVLIGEIGGTQEERAAEFIPRMRKPVIAFIGGRTAPPESRMGHAGAIVAEGRGTYASKVAALEAAGVPVACLLTDVPRLAQQALEKVAPR